MAGAQKVVKEKKKRRGRPFPKGNDLGKKFKKGCPPGPGRPPLPPGFRDALDVMEPDFLRAVHEIALDAGHKDRLQAAEYGLNQKHGKPTQRTELTGAGGGPVRTTTEPEAIAALKRMAKEP